MPKQNILRRMAALARQTQSDDPAVPGSALLPPHHYRLTIASTVMPTYAELKSSYRRVEGWWDENEYKQRLHKSLRKITPPTGEVMVFVKKFDRDITYADAIKWADKHGYRLAFSWEREAFSKANPDLQRKLSIVDLGSFVVDEDGYRYSPVQELRKRRGRSRLDYCLSDDYYGDFDHKRDADDRFLFICR